MVRRCWSAIVGAMLIALSLVSPAATQTMDAAAQAIDAAAAAPETGASESRVGEFVVPGSPQDLSRSVVRVSVRDLRQDPLHFFGGYTRTGVIVAPQTVLVASALLVPALNPATEEIRVMADGRNLVATKLSDRDGMMLLSVPDLQGPAVALPSLHAGVEEVWAFSHRLQPEGLPTPIQRVHADPPVPLAVGSDMSGLDAALLDACGRLVGLRFRTGVAVAAASVGRYLRAQGISPRVVSGYCASNARRGQVESVRQAVATADRAAGETRIETRERAVSEARAGPRTSVLIASIVGVVSAVGALHALAMRPNGRSAARRFGRVAFFGGFVLTSAGLALDPLRYLTEADPAWPRTVDLVCRGQGSELRLKVTDHGDFACVTEDGGSKPYLVADSGSGVVFERRIRPPGTISEGRPIAVESWVLTGDYSRLTVSRGVVPGALWTDAGVVFGRHRDAVADCRATSQDFATAREGLNARRLFTEPYLRQTRIDTRRTYRCEVVSPGD